MAEAQSLAPLAVTADGAHSNELGVYVHVPFCSSRCAYCAFATWTDKADWMQRYVEAVCLEIARASDSGGLRPASTVFFGGGTPSLIGAELLQRLLGAIETLPGAEVTVECNPESTTGELLGALRQAGVTRISLGVQSFSSEVLLGLGREHSPGRAAEAVQLVGDAGFPSFNVDLIYGSVAESDADWYDSLSRVLALQPMPPHISAYALTVEPGTPLSRDQASHPDDDVQAARYEVLDEILAAAGYRWYELSNWSKPGHECRHNLSCWQQGDYLGFGCAAHSHLGGHRFSNVRSIERYLERIEGARSPVVAEEQLDGGARALERLELSLRTRAGVPVQALADDGSLAGLIEVLGGRAVLTRRGRMLANEVALRLIAPVSSSRL